jgi:hypothetical protein
MISYIFGAAVAFLLGLVWGRFLAAPKTPPLAIYRKDAPLDPRRFFEGELEGFGIIEDRDGKPINRFRITTHSSWAGDTGTLREDFTYADGGSEQRLWTLQLGADGTLKGVSADDKGALTATQSGDVLDLEYDLWREINGKPIRFTMQERRMIIAQNPDAILARIAMKKGKFPLARLTVALHRIAS